jgi:O-antigen ligase
MVVCIIILSYFRYGTFFKRFIFDVSRPQFLATLLIVTILSTGILGYITMFTNVSDKMVTFFSTKQGSEIMSVTGRDQIWEIALQEWRRTPLFGYGLTIWDEQYRARIGLSYAVSAHSQFYQSLSSAGIIGVVGFMSYIVLLLSAVMHTARLTGGLSVALFLMIFLRSFSESSIMIDSFGPESITNLLIIMVMATHYGHRPIKKTVITIFYPRRGI